MSLDKLISQYLDGELTHEEDVELRELLRDDISSKHEFDAAVFLSAALREDAESISTPEDVFRDTEDLIMMKFMEALPASEEKKRRKLFFSFNWDFLQNWSMKPAFAMAAVLVIVGSAIGIWQIGEQNMPSPTTKKSYSDVIGSSNKVSNSELSPEEETRTKAQKALNSIIAKPARIVEKTDKIRTYTNSNTNINMVSSRELSNTITEEELSSNQGNLAINNASEQELAVIDKILIEETSLNNYSPININTNGNQDIMVMNTMQNINTNDVVKLSNSNTNSYDMNSNIFYPNSNWFETNSMTLGTFVGKELATISGTVTKIRTKSNYSQSFAYSTSESIKVGFEVGLTEYEYDELSAVRVSPKGISVKILGLDPIGNTNNSGVVLPVILNRDEKLVWAAGFVESSIISNEMMTLNGRLGAGATNYGGLGYAKLLGSVNIYHGFNLTVGADSRIYNLKVGNDNSSWKASAGIIYGLQFKF